MSRPSWLLVGGLIAAGASAGAGCGQGNHFALPDGGGAREAGTIRRDAGALTPESGATTPDSGATLPEGGIASGGRQLAALASGTTGYVLQLDSRGVYYAVVEDESTYQMAIFQVPLVGGASTKLASGQYNVRGLAVSASTVYWVDTYAPVTEPDASTFSDGLVASAPVVGGATTIVASQQALPIAIEADSTSLFWLNSGGGCPVAASCPSSVMRVPLAGGTPSVLATGPTTPQSLALDDANVYWGTLDGRLMKVAKSGGTATQLAYYQTSIGSLVVDATSVYWTTSTGDIMKTPIGGGASTPLLVGVDPIEGLAVDSESVYFTIDTYPAGTVQKLPLGGGPPSTLWFGPDAPWSIRVDSASVYFTTSSGALMKLSPK